MSSAKYACGECGSSLVHKHATACGRGADLARARGFADTGESGNRLARIRLIASGASAKEPAERLFSRLLAISLEADGVTSESEAFL